MKNCIVKKKILCMHRNKVSCPFEINITFTGNNLKIKVISTHNHESENEIVLLNNPISLETKQKMIDLFYQGETPTSALEILKESSENYLSDSKNRSLIPNIADVYYIFKKERNLNFGCQDLTYHSIQSFIHETDEKIKINFCILYPFNDRVIIRNLLISTTHLH